MAEKIKVLLVDDEPDFTKQMSFWLTSKGYGVSVASNGEEALRMIKEGPPDIVFLDLYMPVMDGLQTLKKIRELDKKLPVIIISAYVYDQRIKDVMKEGVSGIFYKGKDFEEGLALLEAALKTHKTLKQK